MFNHAIGMDIFVMTVCQTETLINTSSKSRLDGTRIKGD